MGVVLMSFPTEKCGFAKTSKVCCEKLHGVSPQPITSFRVSRHSGSIVTFLEENDIANHTKIGRKITKTYIFK